MNNTYKTPEVTVLRLTSEGRIATNMSGTGEDGGWVTTCSSLNIWGDNQ